MKKTISKIKVMSEIHDYKIALIQAIKKTTNETIKTLGYGDCLDYFTKTELKELKKLIKQIEKKQFQLIKKSR